MGIGRRHRAQVHIPLTLAELSAIPAFLTIFSATALSAERSPNDMGYLQGFGARAHPVVTLTWGLIAISVTVVAIVGAVLLYAVFRHRPTPALGQMRVARTPDGLRWVYVGTALSAIALLGAAIWTMQVLADVLQPSEPPKLALDITGHQWWWEIRYSGSPESAVFTAANEIHIPVGEPVRLRLMSEDVIHSFWIPALSGKTDLIPGQTNVTWLEADRPGIYRGQCAEFCGAQHAHMAMFVIAQAPADFERWRDAQIAPAAIPATGPPVRGQRAFESRCGACHSVRGSNAGGIIGPDLTHLMSRANIAAGLLPNTPGYLQAWIVDPQQLKPGTQMPRVELAVGELESISSFLQSLK